MPTERHPGEGALTDLLPVARRYLAGVLGAILTAVVLVGATRDGSAIDGAGPVALPIYLALAVAILACLVVAATAGDRSGGPASDRSAESGAGGLDQPSVGLLAPFRSSDGPDEAALRLGQVAHIVDQIDLMMAINVVNALLVTMMIGGTVNSLLLGSWLACVIALAAAGLLSRVRMRLRGAPRSISKRTIRRVTLHAGLRGLIWGACFALFFGDVGATGQLILLSVSLGMLAGGVPALATVPSAALLFALGVVVPTLLRLVAIDGLAYLFLAMFGLTFSASMAMIGGQIYRSFASNILARREQAEQAATISLLLNEFETSASDWLWETDGTGRMVRLPERMIHLFAIARAGDADVSLDDILARIAGPGHRDILRHVEAGTAFRDLHAQTVDAEGGDRTISLTAAPKPEGGWRGVGSDITETMAARRQAAMSLQRAQQAEQRMKDGIDAVAAGLILTDASDRTIMVNRRFWEMFPAGALLGPSATFGEIVAAQGRLTPPAASGGAAAWLADLDEKRRAGAPAFDIELAGGAWTRVEARATTEGGLVTVLTDITDIKQQEAALETHARRLAASNQELQNFAAVASHDLQEPLRKIEAFGSRLKARSAGVLDAEGLEYLERMTVATGRMRRLITDLLSFSRIAKSEQPFARVDLDRLVADVLDDISITIEDKSAVVTVGPLGALDGLATQLRQLFQNLLSNALKFSRPAVAPRIAISSAPGAAGTVEIRLVDNGIGFDMKHHDKIFEIFQRLHGRDQYEGTGIGLATCRRIVERHGGTIRAESVPGEGTTFIMTFPRPAEAAAPAATAAA